VKKKTILIKYLKILNKKTIEKSFLLLFFPFSSHAIPSQSQLQPNQPLKMLK